MTAILVLGASGRTGAQVVDYALSRGHNVVALLRNSSRIAERAGLTIVDGTPANVTDLAAAIQGSGAMIWALGTGLLPVDNPAHQPGHDLRRPQSG
jgi:putative NADH-flavin reductase